MLKWADSNNMKSTSAIAAEKAKKEFQSVYDKALVQLLSKQHIPFTQDFIDIFINWKSKIPPIDVRSSKTLSNHVALRAEEVRSYLVQVLEFCKYKLACASPLTSGAVRRWIHSSV